VAEQLDRVLPADPALRVDGELREVLLEHGRHLHPEELVAAVRREVDAWTPLLDDDLVLLALRRCL